MIIDRPWRDRFHRELFEVRSGQRPALWTALILVFAITGCGDRVVTANGHVLVEGKPASGGRVSLTPVGGGPKVFSLVDESGAFILRTSSNAYGARPGMYHVFFDQPLDPHSREVYARELAGRFNASELSFSYTSPHEKPMSIPEQGSENLTIDVRQQQGWSRELND